jgi:hypothetical protein
MQVKTKFKCDTVSSHAWGGKTVTAKVAELNTVYTNNPEDNLFSAATPSGSIKITVTNPLTMDFLQPGKNYYVYFEECPDQRDTWELNQSIPQGAYSGCGTSGSSGYHQTSPGVARTEQ